MVAITTAGLNGGVTKSQRRTRTYLLHEIKIAHVYISMRLLCSEEQQCQTILYL
jgi:hypothetical protein